MRIGIMGGTFNPPHKGHINAARSAQREIGLDRLIFIPAGIPPHKEMDKNSAKASDRLNMARLAARCIGAEVSDIEISRCGKSFTVDTLKELKRLYPEAELWLIMGTDMFLSLETWREPQTIFSLASIAAVPRNEEDIQKLSEHGKMLCERYGAVSRIIDAPVVTISSSELRPDISSSELSEFLPSEVYDYIVSHHLYGISEGR